MEHDEVLEFVDSIRALHDKFDEDLDEVFGERASKFQPKLRELLLEFWMSSRKRGAAAAARVERELEQELLPKKDWVEELADPGDSRILDALEDRLVELMKTRGTPLRLLQQNLKPMSDIVPVVMDKSTGKTFGVEAPEALFQDNATYFYQVQQFVTNCQADGSGVVWTLNELDFASLPTDDTQITAVWVDDLLCNPGDWFTLQGNDSKGNWRVTQVSFILPRLNTAEVMVHWTDVSQNYGTP